MTFARPEWLFLATAAPAALALSWVTGRRRAHRLAAFAGQGALFPPVVAAAVRGARRDALLAAASLLLLSVAIAGPLGRSPAPSPHPGATDLVVVLDCSRSMLAADGTPTRLAQAKSEVRSLLRRLRGESVGLVAFAGATSVLCPLTQDYEALETLVADLSTDDVSPGGSRPAPAVDAALAVFDPHRASARSILLVTDGEATGSDRLDLAGARLRSAGASLFVLGVGSFEGAPIPSRAGGFCRDRTGAIVLSRLREEALRALTGSAGGVYLRAGAGGADLGGLVAPRAEKAGARAARAADGYRWPLALCLLVLCWDLAGPRRAASALLSLVLLGSSLHPAGADAADAAELAARASRAYAGTDYAAAVSLFLRAQVEDPQSAVIAYNLGNARYRAGQFQEALASYRVALRSAPPTLRAKILYNLGNAAFRLGRLAEAQGHYREALRLAPTDADARLNRNLAAARLAERRRAPRSRLAASPGIAERRSPAGSPAGREAKPSPSAGAGEALSSRSPPGGGTERPAAGGGAIPSVPRDRRRWAEGVLEGLREAPRPGVPPSGGRAEEDW